MPRSSQMYAGTGLLIALLVVVLILCGLAFGGLNAHRGTHSLNVVLLARAVGVRCPRLSAPVPAKRLALGDQRPAAMGI